MDDYRSCTSASLSLTSASSSTTIKVLLRISLCAFVTFDGWAKLIFFLRTRLGRLENFFVLHEQDVGRRNSFRVDNLFTATALIARKAMKKREEWAFMRTMSVQQKELYDYGNDTFCLTAFGLNEENSSKRMSSSWILLLNASDIKIVV